MEIASNEEIIIPPSSSFGRLTNNSLRRYANSASQISLKELPRMRNRKPGHRRLHRWCNDDLVGTLFSKEIESYSVYDGELHYQFATPGKVMKNLSLPGLEEFIESGELNRINSFEEENEITNYYEKDEMLERIDRNIYSILCDHKDNQVIKLLDEFLFLCNKNGIASPVVEVARDKLTEYLKIPALVQKSNNNIIWMCLSFKDPFMRFLCHGLLQFYGFISQSLFSKKLNDRILLFRRSNDKTENTLFTN